MTPENFRIVLADHGHATLSSQCLWRFKGQMKA